LVKDKGFKMSKQKRFQAESGSALFYVLLGVVLFAAVSFVTTQQSNNDGLVTQLTDQRADIIANKMINHATAMRFTVQQMLQNGSTIDDLDFIMPHETGFDTPPHQHKVFHPGGGGMTPMVPKADYFDGVNSRGWRASSGNTNIEWSETTDNDRLYSFLDLHPAICAKINEKLLGSSTIPVSNFNYTNVLDSSGSADFTTSNCADCEGIPSLCIVNGNPTYAFYNTIILR
jgi:hypothetical protein